MGIPLNATRFRGDEDGSILILVALSLAAFFGFLALTFDLGRVAVTQTEIQSYADNVALAAAGELDGNAGAIARATSAASAMIADTQTFGGGGADLTASDYTLTFLKSLPASDTDPITSANHASGDSDARFVEVKIAGRSVQMSFGAVAAALNGTTINDPDVGATAVAGFSLMACDITPMMFCLPNDAAWKADEAVGHMVQMRAGGNNSAWGPGNFGFLKLDDVIVDPAGPCGGLTGAQRTRCLLGSTDFITRCFAQNGVDTDPGQSVGINDISLNVRFDIYEGNFKSESTSTYYSPAPNVLKGIPNNGPGNTCEPGKDTLVETVSLPKDSCFPDGCPAGRFGDGNYDMTEYLQKNYYNSPMIPNPLYTQNGTEPQYVPKYEEDLSAADIPSEITDAETRYDLYLAEIALMKEIAGTDFASVPADPVRRTQLENLVNYSILGTNKTETALPQCSTAAPGRSDRRLLIAAGVDCTTNPINGAEVGVPVKEFVELFMTHPVGEDSTSGVDIWAEVVSSAGGGTGGGASIIRDVVQLYR